MKFTPEDFEDVEDGCTCGVCIAKIANAKLRELLDKAPTLWGYSFDGGFKPICVHEIEKRGKATHIGKVICIERDQNE